MQVFARECQPFDDVFQVKEKLLDISEASDKVWHKGIFKL